MTPAELARLHGACFTAPRPWSEQEFESLLAGTGAFLVTAPQGFALGRALADEAELLTIAVRPDMQRGGIGRRLLSDFLAEAQARGAAAAFLEVAADNLPALSLYRGAGFQQVGQRRGYYAGPGGRKVDALVLSRALAVAQQI